jgi:hypothetical protein
MPGGGPVRIGDPVGKRGLSMNNATLINQDSGVTEYGTPKEIIERARATMGAIDLDPASSEIFNRNVGALFFHTKEDRMSSFELPWNGRVWMNHPFSRGEKACVPNCKKTKCVPSNQRNVNGDVMISVPSPYAVVKGQVQYVKAPSNWRGHCIDKDIPSNADWINKLVAEYEAGRVTSACCITFASTSEGWFKPLHRFPQCYIYGRVRFVNSDLTPSGTSTKGAVVTYLGVDVCSFANNFKDIGAVKVPVGM